MVRLEGYEPRFALTGEYPPVYPIPTSGKTRVFPNPFLGFKSLKNKMVRLEGFEPPTL